jgi:Zn-dependent peptidase ImmA (M78 family)
MLQIIKEKELGHPIFRSELLPIDPAKLVPELGARLEEVEELGSAMLRDPWAERDTKVHGLFDRRGKRIIIDKREPFATQRYTIGHEIAHLLYHSNPYHLRERAVRVRDRKIEGDRDSSNHKCEEREAEIFAAEFMMPADLVREAMVQRFGAPIDGAVPHEGLAHFLSASCGQKIDSYKLAGMPQEERAALFAEVKSFAGRAFESLYRQFGVSKGAMAIRLLELGLVS